MMHALEARARLGEHRFLDVQHRNLVADPRGTVRRVYEWLGLELEDGVAKTIFDWQDTHAMGADGSHRYTPAQFGLSADRIRSDYDFYIRHFDVPLED
jgi:hypothetical protein